MSHSLRLVFRIALAAGAAVCLAFVLSHGRIAAAGKSIKPGTAAARRSSHFRLVYPQTIDAQDADQVLSILEANRAELVRRVSTAGIDVHLPNLEIVINETTGDFVGRTGMPAWAAAATQDHKIELQPLKLLKQRRILETTLRHELVHVLIDMISGGQTPHWFTEGMAIYFAGEGRSLERLQQNNSTSAETVERALASAKSATEMRTAYAGAYKLVADLIRVEGERKVWERIVCLKSFKPQRSTKGADL